MTEAKMLVFDAETTGIDTSSDRIVQLFMATADEDGNLLDTHEWVIDPGVSVPEEAAAVHGFSTEYLQEHGVRPEAALKDALSVFMANRSLVWVAFNLNYDLSILDAEFERHIAFEGFGERANRAIRLFDPLVVDRAKDKYRKGKRKLEFMAPHYGVDFDADAAHKADYDVEITAKVASKVAHKFGIPGNAEQAEMHAEWAEGLEQYLRRTDPSATVERDWPVRLKEENVVYGI